MWSMSQARKRSRRQRWHLLEILKKFSWNTWLYGKFNVKSILKKFQTLRTWFVRFRKGINTRRFIEYGSGIFLLYTMWVAYWLSEQLAVSEGLFSMVLLNFNRYNLSFQLYALLINQYKFCWVTWKLCSPSHMVCLIFSYDCQNIKKVILFTLPNERHNSVVTEDLLWEGGHENFKKKLINFPFQVLHTLLKISETVYRGI